jgi:hypothetical protein
MRVVVAARRLRRKAKVVTMDHPVLVIVSGARTDFIAPSAISSRCCVKNRQTKKYYFDCAKKGTNRSCSTLFYLSFVCLCELGILPELSGSLPLGATILQSLFLFVSVKKSLHLEIESNRGGNALG